MQIWAIKELWFRNESKFMKENKFTYNIIFAYFINQNWMQLKIVIKKDTN